MASSYNVDILVQYFSHCALQDLGYDASSAYIFV